MDELIEQYAKEVSSTQTETFNSSIIYTLKRLFRVLEITDANKIRKKMLIDAFNKMNLRHVHAFMVYRSMIYAFFVWLEENGHVENHLAELMKSISYDDLSRNDLLEKYYFSDFADLTDHVDRAIKSCVSSDQVAQFDIIRAACVLSWYGITPDIMVEIKKQDMIDGTCEIVHPTTKALVQLHERAYSTVARFRDADGFHSSSTSSNGIRYYQYKDSEYLFRNIATDKLDYIKLTHQFKYFNQKIDNSIGKVFNLSKIQQSGMYWRIYLDEKTYGKLDGSQIDRLLKWFGNERLNSIELKKQDRLNLRNRLKVYQEYKKIMY